MLPAKILGAAGGLAAAACIACPPAVIASAPASALAPQVQDAHVQYACSGPHSASVPCHFSTPKRQHSCLWTPRPNNVACERLATGRAYRLRPTGRAKAIKLRLRRRGQTLPTSQQVVFPESLSCHDTNTTMTCNQDYGLGEFKLAPRGSHAPEHGRHARIPFEPALHENLAWSYPAPLAESEKIAGLIAFYDEKVDLHVGGVQQERPHTEFS